MAYNIVGPGLPQALQLLRYPKHNRDGTLRATNKEDPETVAATCLEDHAANIITSEEERRLREDSEMLDTLEDIYSLTCVTTPYPRHIFLIMSYNIQAERPVMCISPLCRRIHERRRKRKLCTLSRLTLLIIFPFPFPLPLLVARSIWHLPYPASGTLTKLSQGSASRLIMAPLSYLHVIFYYSLFRSYLL
jgi:hypothetical protein